VAIQGSCLCGTVRYEVDGPFSSMMNCHCSMCRKHHGAPFATFVVAPIGGFRWLSGEHEQTHYRSSPSAVRSSCRTCGSVTPFFMPDAGVVVLHPGNLDGDPGARLEGHIFVGSKAPWHDILDSLPRYEEYPPDFAGAVSIERPVVNPEAGKTFGSCLCGEVAYEITGAPVVMYQCHCTRCRKSRSAAHGANMFYKLDKFRWIRGESLVVDYKLPEAARFGVAFCRQCGGATPRAVAARGAVIVPAGPLDTDPGARPAAHIFVGSKAPWFEITDAIPQIAEGPPPPP
jgi:hypothetical protein